MRFILPLILFLIFLFLAVVFFIPRLTKISKTSKDLLMEKEIKNDVLRQNRHFDLFEMQKYLGVVNSLKYSLGNFFQTELHGNAEDSLKITLSNLERSDYLESFKKVFFNKNDISRMKEFKNLPIRLLDSNGEYGFIAEIIQSQDSNQRSYIKLQYDALVGALKEKISREKKEKNEK